MRGGHADAAGAGLMTPHRRQAPTAAGPRRRSAQQAVAAGVGIGETAFDGDDALWLEQRPSEKGRCVVVRRRADGRMRRPVRRALQRTQPRARVRRRRLRDAPTACCIFSNDRRPAHLPRRPRQRAAADHARGGAALSPTSASMRAAACCGACARTTAATAKPRNSLVALRCDGDARRRPGGRRRQRLRRRAAPEPRRPPAGLAAAGTIPTCPSSAASCGWPSVDDDGALHGARCIAGSRDEAVQQPLWSSEGELLFVSDRSGWWNLYRWRDGQAQAAVPDGRPSSAKPPWVFGHEQPTPSSRRAGWPAATRSRAVSQLAVLDLDTLQLRDHRHALHAHRQPGGAGRPAAVLRRIAAAAARRCAGSTWTAAAIEVLRQGSSIAVDPRLHLGGRGDSNSPPRMGRRRTASSTRRATPTSQAPPASKPPLLVLSHGGPTSMARTTTRPASSTGPAAALRCSMSTTAAAPASAAPIAKRLDGQWGVADVEDCVHGARFLVQRGDVDGAPAGHPRRQRRRLHHAVRAGLSRHAFTAAAAATASAISKRWPRHAQVRSALPRPADRPLARSARAVPRTLADPPPGRLQLPADPVPGLRGQGGAARAVAAACTPPSRPRACRWPTSSSKASSTAFARPPNIVRALEAEACFYARVFGFALADAVEPVAIDNL